MGLRHAILVPATLGVVVGLTGCRGESETVAQVKQRYARLFVDGFEFGLAGRVKAAAYDPATMDLIDVRLDLDDERLYHAERVEMLVNPDRDTMTLRLLGVVGAQALGEDAESDLVEFATLTTEEVDLGFDVRP